MINATWRKLLAKIQRSQVSRPFRRKLRIKFPLGVEQLEDRIMLSGTPPIAAPDAYTLYAGTVLRAGGSGNSAAGVLANDIDVQGDALTASLVGSASHGTLSLSANGNFTYSPASGFIGTDSFQYQANDGSLASNTATVTLFVVDAAPTAVADAYKVQALTLGGVTAALQASGGLNGLTATQLTGFANQVRAAGAAWQGVWQQIVTTNNLVGLPGLGLNATASSGVLANDVDPDNGPLTATLTGGPGNGQLTLNPNGSFNYVPMAGFTGTDSFTYQISDGILKSATATVTLQIVDTTPILSNSSFDLHANTTFATGQSAGAPSSLLANLANASGDSLQTTLISNVAHGTLTLGTGGSFSYVPSANFTGQDTFQYAVFGGARTSNTATVTLNIGNVAPVASAANFFVPYIPNTTGSGIGDTMPGSGSGGSLGGMPGGGSGGSSGGTPSFSGAVFSDEFDADGDPLTATLVSGPSNGTFFSLNSMGGFGYTPAPGFIGTDSFRFQVSDGMASSNTATITLTVVGPNTLIAANDSYTLNPPPPGTGGALPLGGNVLNNDYNNVPGNLVTVLSSGPANGTLTFNADGSFTYTPNAGFYGTDQFAYQDQVMQLMGLVPFVAASASATVKILVAQPNPTSNGTAVVQPFDDSYTIPHDQLLVVATPGGVVANDRIWTAGTIAATVVQGVSHGTLDFRSSGVFNYLPAQGFVGVDRFTYSVNGSATATVTINVTDAPPTATDDSYTVVHDTGLLVPVLQGVLANDSDPDQDLLTATLVNPPANGQLTLNPNGSIYYMPNPGFVGTDMFTYRASDGVNPADASGSSNIAAVTINVTDAAPQAQNATYALAAGTVLAFPQNTGLAYLGSDSNNDLLTAQLIAGPANGTLTLQPSGAFVYTPAPGFFGSDAFVYQLNDGVLGSNLASVTLNVTASAPTTGNLSFSTPHDTALTVSPLDGVLANVASPSGQLLTAQLVSAPANGTLTLGAGGSFTYTPNAGFIGNDSFTFDATDGQFVSAVSTVSISVTDQVPIAANAVYSVNAGRTLTVSRWAGLLSNAGTAQSLTVALVSGPAHGSLSLDPSGAFIYVPAAGFLGADTFAYQATDGLLTSSPGVVTISVMSAVLPLADSNSGFTVLHDTPLIVPAWNGVLTGVTGGDGSALTAVLVGGPAHGSLTLNVGGSFLYTPAPGFVGTDTFTFQVTNDAQTSAVATATITVTDSAPTAAPMGFTLAHDTTLLVDRWDGVLSGAADVDGDPITAILVSGPGHGNLTLYPNGSFAYTPSAGFAGTDSFSFQASDGILTSAATTVTLTVSPDAAPVAVNDTYTTSHDQALVVTPDNSVLNNDTDTDGDVLTSLLVSGPGHGAVTLNVGGSFIYTPSAGFVGTDSFTYQAYDGMLPSNVATVTITVTEAAPTVANTSYQAAQNDTLFVPDAIGVLAQSTDADGDPLTAVLISGPSNGTLVFGASGSFSYTPAPGFTGMDQFTYQATDGLLNSATATATIQVSAGSPVLTFAPPTAAADTFTTTHDQLLAVGFGDGVLANDTDPTGAPLTAVLVTGTNHGSLDLAADGSFSYMPAAGYVGSDTFTYQADDGTGTSSPATITITVTDALPVVTDGTYTVAAGQPLQVDALDGVLANASDADGDPMTAVLVAGPSNGSLSLNGDGSFDYTPAAGFTGTDTFTFQASDGLATGNTGTVSISVTDPVPSLSPISFSTVHGTPLVVDAGNGLLANLTPGADNPLTAVLVSGPSHGNLSPNPDGSFLYTPAAGFAGTDSFTYDVTDGIVTSAVATVNLTVTDAAPVVAAASYSIPHDQVLVVDAALGLTATDADGDVITLSVATAPAHGSVTVNSDGSFEYAPNSGFVGTDTFVYQASDGIKSSTATVSVNVTDALPVAPAASFSTIHDTVLTVASMQGLLATVSDADGNPLAVDLVAGPSSGSLTLEPDGSFVYVPGAGFVGTDQFSYTITDGLDTSAPAVVTIAVTNAAPVAKNASYTTSQNNTLYVSAWNDALNNTLWNGPFSDQDLLSFASDADGDPLTASLVQGPAHGSVTVEPDGTFVYAPNTGFVGIDSFQYQVSDGLALSNVATATLTVTGAVPAANNDSYSVTRNGILSVTENAGNILANDTVSSGAPLTAQLVTGPAHGTLTLTAQGSFLYTPTLGYVGIDSFTYQAVANGLASASATVWLTVADTAPVAANVPYSVLAGGSLSLPSAGVLAFASDADGDPLTASVLQRPMQGSLSFNSNGTFTYTPNAGFTGGDSFTYQVSDGVLTGTGSVTLTVTTDPLAVSTQNAQVIHDAAVNQASAVANVAALAAQQVQTTAQFNEMTTYEANLQADDVTLAGTNTTAGTALALALAGDEQQQEQVSNAAGMLQTGADEQAEESYSASVDAAGVAYAQAEAAASATERQSITAALTQQDTTEAQAAGIQAAADQTAQAAHVTAVAAADSAFNTSASQAEAIYQGSVQQLGSAYNTAAGQAQSLMDGQLQALQATQVQADAQDQAVLQTALQQAETSRTTSATDAASQRDSVVGQALTVYQQAMAAAQAADDPSGQANGAASPSLGSDPNYLQAVAQAQVTYESVVEAADLTYNSALTAGQAAYDGAVQTADADYDSATFAVATVETQAVQAATAVFNQAVQAALVLDNTAVAGAAATYQAAYLTAQTAYANAEQSADQGYDSATQGAQTVYYNTAQQAQQTDDAAYASALQGYEQVMTTADQVYNVALQQGQQVYQQAVATAVAGFDGASQQSQQNYATAVQSAQQAYNNAVPYGAFLTLDNAAWTAVITNQAAQQAAQATLQQAAQSAEAVYNSAVNTASQAQRQANALAQFNQAAAYEAANDVLLGARDTYGTGTSAYQNAQKTYGIATAQADLTLAQAVQANTVTFITAEEVAARTKAIARATAANITLAQQMAADQQEMTTVAQSGQTFESAQAAAQSTQSNALGAATQAQSNSSIAALTNWEDALANAGAGLTTAQAQALATWQTTEANASGMQQLAQASADAGQAITLAGAQQTLQDTLVVVGDNWAQADAAAQQGFVDALAGPAAQAVVTVAAADAAWQTSVAAAYGQWDGAVAVAAAQATTSATQALVDWQDAVVGDGLALNQVQAAAGQAWSAAEAPAESTAQQAETQTRAAAINSWATSQNTGWAQYLQAEGDARLAFWQQAAPAQSTLEVGQAQEVDSWLQAFGVNANSFTTTEGQSLVAWARNASAATATEGQNLDIALVGFVSGTQLASVAATTRISQAAATDFEADAGADGTLEDQLAQTAQVAGQTVAAAQQTETVTAAQAAQTAAGNPAGASAPTPAASDARAVAQATNNRTQTAGTAQQTDQLAGDHALEAQAMRDAAAEAGTQQAAAQATQTWQQQQALALLSLQLAQAANPGQLQAALAVPIAQDALAQANADQALRLVQAQNQTQVAVNAARANLVAAQQQSPQACTNQPQQPASFLYRAGVVLLVAVIVIVVVVAVIWTAGTVLPFIGGVVAAILPAAVTGFIATCAGYIGIAVGILLVATAIYSGVNRARDGQSAGECILGGVLDAVGVTGVAQGYSGEDLVTGTNYDAMTGTRHDLTDAERGFRLGVGLVSLFGVGSLVRGARAWQLARAARGVAAAEAAPVVRPPVAPVPPTTAQAAGLRPANFGLRTIAEDAEALRMWNEAMRSAANSSRANGYTRYLQALDRGEAPTNEMLDSAFDAVNSRFLEAYRAAGNQAYAVHHWNFDRNTFPNQVLDPRNLVPVPNRQVHEAIHRGTSSTTNIWRGPIAPEHEINIPNDVAGILAP